MEEASEEKRLLVWVLPRRLKRKSIFNEVSVGLLIEVIRCDVSIDTANRANSAELIVGIHITEDSTYAFERSDSYGLFDTTSHVSHEDDVPWYDRSAFLDSFTNSNESANTNVDDDITNDSTNESVKSDFWIGKRQS